MKKNQKITKLFTNISGAFRYAQKQWKPQQADILVGYFGIGATKVLTKLGFRKIRFVFGLPDSKPKLIKSKITELKLLQSLAEVKTSQALHAKVYIMDDAVVIIGSANLSSAGFGGNQEAVILTNQSSVVTDARKFFSAIWKDARPLNIKKIKSVAVSKTHGEESGSIGKHSLDPTSLFAGAHKTPKVTKSSTNQQIVDPKIRICAFPIKRFHEGKLLGKCDKIEWSATTTTLEGDVHLFCVTKGSDDELSDVVHSIWQATSDHIHRKGRKWPERAKFKRILTLGRPVKKSDLIGVGLLMKKHHVGWPMNNSGKLLKSEATVIRLAQVLSKANPKQRAKIFTALHANN